MKHGYHGRAPRKCLTWKLLQRLLGCVCCGHSTEKVSGVCSSSFQAFRAHSHGPPGLAPQHHLRLLLREELSSHLSPLPHALQILSVLASTLHSWAFGLACFFTTSSLIQLPPKHLSCCHCRLLKQISWYCSQHSPALKLSLISHSLTMDTIDSHGLTTFSVSGPALVHPYNCFPRQTDSLPQSLSWKLMWPKSIQVQSSSPRLWSPICLMSETMFLMSVCPSGDLRC